MASNNNGSNELSPIPPQDPPLGFDCDGGDGFQKWYKEVDRICTDMLGIGIEDLAEGPSFDSYNDEITPEEYVLEIMPEYDDLLAHFFEATR